MSSTAINNLRDTKVKDPDGNTALNVVIANPGDIAQQKGETLAAGETISAVKAVFSNGTNLFLGDADTDFQEASIVGITLTAGTAGNEIRYQLIGPLYDSSFSFIDGEPVFLDLNGNLTQTDPASLGYRYRVLIGFATGANGININIREPIEIL